MIRLCVGIAAFFCLVTVIFPGQIMRIYTVGEEIIRFGIRYLNYSAVAYFLLGLSLTCTITLPDKAFVSVNQGSVEGIHQDQYPGIDQRWDSGLGQ